MWYLEGFTDDERQTWRTLVHRFPFFVGRRRDTDLHLSSRQISSRHAELYVKNGRLWLRDWQSTNGTFVNGVRITDDHPLTPGDRLGFARHELRLVETPDVHYLQTTDVLAVDPTVLSEAIHTRGAELRAMLDDGALRIHYQPLVDLREGKTVAYEALGRGWRENRLLSPAYLFELAESPEAEVRLSHELRLHAVEQAAALSEAGPIFLNTHPSELRGDVRPLLESIESLRESFPETPVTLEVHEATVAHRRTLGALGDGLRRLGVDLAFDDFGTGQARLLELSEVEPHYLKFDRDWIQDIDRASRQRREMVGHLVRMVQELGIAAIAEGVETPAEAEACRDLGFDLGQGFHFAHPAPAEDLASDSARGLEPGD